MSDEAIDMKEVMERVHEDKELLKELLQIFLEDYVEKKQALEQAVAHQDFEAVKSISHGMKGASGNISAKKLRVSFLNLEQMAKANDFASGRQTLDLIDQQVNELKDFVENNFKPKNFSSRLLD